MGFVRILMRYTGRDNFQFCWVSRSVQSIERSTFLNIRKIIADRLQYELNRRDISLADVAKNTKISIKKLEKYIEGSTEITITDIVSICELVGINAVRLLYSKEYPEPKLSFRNANFDVQYSASQIEDAFLTIRDAFPKIDPTGIQGFQRKVKDTGFDAVMVAAADCAESVRKQFPTPEDFILKNNIPVFPINEKQNGFDGFLISIGQHRAICVNTNKPPHRIRFTLCHEISHLLYDQNKNVPIDVFIPNLYRDTYSLDEIPEFFAYKFAQFYLLPFNPIKDHVIKNWPKLDNDKLQLLVERRGASVNVLVNVLFDIIRLNDGLKPRYEKLEYQRLSTDYHRSKSGGSQFDRMDYQEGRDDPWADERPWYDDQPKSDQKTSRAQIKQYCNAFKSSTQAKKVHGFLRECHDRNKACIQKTKGDFSEDVLKFITGTLQIEL